MLQRKREGCIATESASPPPPPSRTRAFQEQHRQLMNRRDVRSAADFLRFVKKLVFEERSRDERAQGRRNCALGRGQMSNM